MGDVRPKGVETDVERDIEYKWSRAAKCIPIHRAQQVGVAPSSHARAWLEDRARNRGSAKAISQVKIE